MIPAQRRKNVEYRRPRRINAVSVTLFAAFGLGAYVLVCMWPVLSLRSKAKSELEDVVSRLWRTNLLGDAVFHREGPQLKKDLLARLRKAGIRDPKLAVTFERNKKFVAAEARFTATAEFGVINKTYTFDLAPRALTKAEAVDW